MVNLLKEDQNYILNTYKRLDLIIERGEGSYLIDSEGNRYLDFFSGISVNHLGHNHEEIKKRIKNQIDHYIHLSNFFVSPHTVNLAKILVENSFASKVFFSNSGTEANEAAIKLARKYGKAINTHKVEIASSLHSFHGRTFGGMSVTGQEKYKEAFQPVLDGVKHFTFNDVGSLREAVGVHTTCVFIELIQGEGGIRVASHEFIEELVCLAKKYQFLIIVDEIQTGLGRTGELFAYMHYNLKPDIVTIAKSLGGGLPLGAMLVSKECEDILGVGDHGSTFGGNPVACSVGEYVVETIKDPLFIHSIQDKSYYLFNELEQLQKKYKVIKEVRGRGLMIGIDVGDWANTIRDKALQRYLLLNVTNQTVLRLLPPLTISFEEINSFLKIMEDVLKEVRL